MTLDLTAVRTWAVANGKPTGARGRVSRSVIADFLVANPRTLREIAAIAGVSIGKRGRVTLAQAQAVIEASNKPAPVFDPYLLNV